MDDINNQNSQNNDNNEQKSYYPQNYHQSSNSYNQYNQQNGSGQYNSYNQQNGYGQYNNYNQQNNYQNPYDNYYQPQNDYRKNVESPQRSLGPAITSMVLGVLSLQLSCFWFLSAPCAIIGLVLGISAIKNRGKGFSIAGIITSAITLALLFLLLLIGISTDSYYDYDDYFYGLNHSISDYDTPETYL